MTCGHFLIDLLYHIHAKASCKLNRVMFAMTFIISDVVSYAKTGDCGRFCLVACAGMHRWQISIQASIPWRINSARPRLRSEKISCLFKACSRNDSYCSKTLSSDSMAVGESVDSIFSFFFCASRHVLYFWGEDLFQI